MNIYLLNIILVLIFALFSRTTMYDCRTINDSMNLPYKAKRCDTVMCICLFLLMFVEMGFRGDFCIDTCNYKYIFDDIGQYEISRLISNGKDILFYIFTYLIHSFSDSYLLYLLITAFILSWAYTKFVYNESQMKWLSILILFCGGSFYSGFNVMRIFLVAALSTLSYKYTLQKKPVKYFGYVLFLSAIHLSALVMIPVYFFPRMQLKRLSKGLIVAIGLLLAIVFFVFSDNIMSIVTKVIYTGYGDASHFGVSEGVSLAGTLKGLVLFGIPVVCNGYFKKYDARDMLVRNGCVCGLISVLCGYNIFIIQRFTHYFVPCMMLAYPMIATRIKNKGNRTKFVVFVTILLIASGLNQVLDPNYYFYWDNLYMKW